MNQLLDQNDTEIKTGDEVFFLHTYGDGTKVQLKAIVGYTESLEFSPPYNIIVKPIDRSASRCLSAREVVKAEPGIENVAFRRNFTVVGVDLAQELSVYHGFVAFVRAFNADHAEELAVRYLDQELSLCGEDAHMCTFILCTLSGRHFVERTKFKQSNIAPKVFDYTERYD